MNKITKFIIAATAILMGVCLLGQFLLYGYTILVKLVLI